MLIVVSAKKTESIHIISTSKLPFEGELTKLGFNAVELDDVTNSLTRIGPPLESEHSIVSQTRKSAPLSKSSITGLLGILIGSLTC